MGPWAPCCRPATLTLDDFEGHEGCNEILNVTRPDIVRSVHDAYFEAGADCVETNTFGANLANLGEYDIADRICELSEAGARIAREVADELRHAGPPALGARLDGARAPSCRPSATSRSPCCATPTRQGGRAAARRRRRDPRRDLPGPAAGQGRDDRRPAGHGRGRPRHAVLFAHVTVETTGTMLLGSEIGAALTALEPLGIDVIGLNCATGPPR